MSLPNHADLAGGISPRPLAGSAAFAASSGRVVFIGVGVGDAELLTLAAARAIAEADHFVIDRADLNSVLEHPAVAHRADAQVVCLDDLVDEARFNAALEQALLGHQVVRLVAGDTIANCSCREEAAACVAQGVPVDFLPGVSPLTAMPTYAGAGFPGANATQFIAVGAEGLGDVVVPATGCVSIMCRSDQVDAVVEAAYAAGRAHNEHVMLTLRGSTSAQRTVVADLGKVAATTHRETNAAAPEAINLVLGYEPEGVIDWFESKPLFGWKVLVPRTRENPGDIERLLRRHGATTHSVPTISVEPPRNPQQMDKAITGLVDGRYEWVVFTSGNAVRAVLEKLAAYGLDARAFSGLRVAATGPFTASVLADWGITPDLIPEETQCAGLAAEFPVYDDLLDPINRVLIPRADIATEGLAQALSELGWEVEDVTAYRTVRAAPPPAETREAIKTGKFDAVVFTSSSTVRNLLGIAGKPPAQTIIAAIGPATAETCAELGLRVDVTAPNPSHASLVESLVAFAAERRANLLAEGEQVVPPSQRKRRRSR